MSLEHAPQRNARQTATSQSALLTRDERAPAQLPQRNDGDVFLTREQLARRWHVKPAAITRNYRKLGLTPFTAMGLLFLLRQIVEIERANMARETIGTEAARSADMDCQAAADRPPAPPAPGKRPRGRPRKHPLPLPAVEHEVRD
jgi:hypothetical protein